MLLLAGGVAIAFFLGPRVPRQHLVTLRLRAPQTVTGVELAWAPTNGAALPHADAMQGGTWRFAPGAAPPTVQTQVSVPDGSYDLEVQVERGGASEAVHRVIRFGDADNITVPLP